jgi:AbrB family looped-hinge helix DNA binding protein
MRLTIRVDKSGRLVIPKPVRDRLGLVEGTEFELHELPDGLVLKRLSRDLALEEVGGLLVHRGRSNPEGDLRHAVLARVY